MATTRQTARRLARSQFGQSAILQTIFIAICGVVLPNVMFVWDKNGALNATGVNSIIAAILAGILASILLRKITTFPGAANLHLTLPSLSAAYGIVIVFILFLRKDYSNTVLISSFVATLVCQVIVLIMNDRMGMIHLYAVQGGKLVQHIPSLRYQVLDQPCVPDDPKAVIVADLHHDHAPEWQRVFAEAALLDVPVYHYKQVREALSGRVQIQHLSENSFGSLIPSLTYRGTKRIIDIVACLVLLPILLIPMLVVAVLIKVTSPGPVFFSQQRMGYRGRPFLVYKFRTMTIAPLIEGDEGRLNAITQSADARVTRIGRFLRRSRIDELPQILNILRGEMSWIGPRPEAMPLSAWYEREIAFYSYRHIVRPGVTGWAQVNQGHVAELSDVEEKLEYDFYYIKNFSYWLDLYIVSRTVIVMLTGFGSK